MVKVGVTVGKQTYVNWMPILDYNNKSVPVKDINTFLINKAIQRCLVKAIAMHGLGLYVYRGEDLPNKETDEVQSDEAFKNIPVSNKCSSCDCDVNDNVKSFSIKKYHKVLCRDCQNKR